MDIAIHVLTSYLVSLVRLTRQSPSRHYVVLGHSRTALLNQISLFLLFFVFSVLSDGVEISKITCLRSA